MDNIIQVPNPGFGDTIPRNLGMMENSDVVEEVHHDSCVPASGENFQSEIGTDNGNAEEDDKPIIAVAQENVMSKSIDLTNPTPSSNFVRVKGKEFSYQTEYEPTPFLHISW